MGLLLFVHGGVVPHIAASHNVYGRNFSCNPSFVLILFPARSATPIGNLPD